MIQDSGETEPVAVDPLAVTVTGGVSEPDPETTLPEGGETACSELPFVQPEEVLGAALSTPGPGRLPVPESAIGNSSGTVSTTVSSTVSTWQFGADTSHWIGTSRMEVA